MTRQVSAGPYSVTTAPSLIECPTCKSPIVVATVRGFDEHIDTAMVNQAGELAALLEGLRTFELRNDYLMRRTHYKIREARNDAPVLVQHRCGRTIPNHHLNPAWHEASIAIVVMACGGTIVSQYDRNEPPPF